MLDVPLFLLGLNVNAAPSGSGGGGYTAQAVHYDTNTVVLGNMTGTDGPLLGMSAWFYYDQLGVSDGTFETSVSLFQSDNGPTIYVTNDNIYVACGNADGTVFVTWLTSETVSLSNWYHLIVGTDCSDVDPDNWRVAGYLNDQQLTFSVRPPIIINGDPFPQVQGPGPLNNGMFNCNMQIVDWHGIIMSESVADLFIYADQSLLTGSDISLAHRRLFIDGSGKPVDPATAVAALGSPTMLFSGNATGFVTNQGSGGGAFAVSEGALTNAATHP